MELEFPWWLRITHYINIVSILFLIRSGIEIFTIHPKLYWNNASKPGSEWARFTRKKMPKDKLYDTVAVVAGGISLTIFGLLGAPSSLRAGPEPTYVASGVLSVTLTGGVLLLLRPSHLPAGATTLIVSLALSNTPREMLTLMARVVILTVSGWIINRLCGIPMSLWANKDKE